MKLLILLVACAVLTRALVQFGAVRGARARLPSAKSTPTSMSESGGEAWQDDVEKILDIDSTCDDRKALVGGLRSKVEDIRKDVQEAVRERDLQKVAPKDTKYGKDIRGFFKFREQVRNDILPEIINKGVPALFSSGPKVAQQVLEEAGGPAGIAKQAQEAVEKITEISQDPSALQYTIDEVRREVKNIVKSTPEGLEAPDYQILKMTDNYEIREYAPYSLVSTSIESNEEMAEETMANGNGFNKLAKYILEGENAEEEKMSMTTPVITNRDTMSFVMPSGFTAENAPAPTDADLQVQDVPKQIVAVREFTGLVTEKESAKQRAALEDSLLADGLEFDNLSFKTLQYNPPYTLPWIRRNEVTLIVTSEVAMTNAAPISDIATIDEMKSNSSIVEEATGEPEVAPDSNEIEDKAEETTEAENDDPDAANE